MSCVLSSLCRSPGAIPMLGAKKEVVIVLSCALILLLRVWNSLGLSVAAGRDQRNTRAVRDGRNEGTEFAVSLS